MPQRLLPRPWREVGKRGQILLTFGFIWVGVGYGDHIRPTPPPTWEHIPLLREIPLGWAWIFTGLIAMAYALRPRIIPHDGLGFLALYLMPAYRAGAYLLAWLDSIAPTVGGPGYPLGWLAALLYLAQVAAVMICARWPEPPLTSDGEPRQGVRR